MEYRSLAPKEIEALLRQGCEANDWNDIQVADPFAVHQINNVRCTGCVFLRDPYCGNASLIAGECRGSRRPDGKNVKFVKATKTNNP